jgi:hypothetical protein
VRGVVLFGLVDKRLNMVEIIVAAIIGIAVGIGGTVVVQNANKNDVQVVAVGGDQVAKEQVEVQKKLIDLDLLVEPCGKEFIEKHDALLCREMFCRMQTRGIDSQTSQTDCESISNLANTKEIQDTCKGLEGEKKEACEDLFFKRK